MPQSDWLSQIKNTQAEIWSKTYHIQKTTFSLKDENCSYIKKNWLPVGLE